MLAKTTGKRPQVTGATVEVDYLGTPHYFRIDPARVQGLYWADRAVLEILAPFYKTFQIDLWPHELPGDTAMLEKLFGNGETAAPVSPAMVESLWNTKDAAGFLPPFMLKPVRCIAARAYYVAPQDGVWNAYAPAETLPTAHRPTARAAMQRRKPEAQGKRPSVTGLTVEVDYNGEIQRLAIDPARTQGLFWTERTVLEILAPFYETFQIDLRPTDLPGDATMLAKLFGNGETSVPVSPAMVESLWNTTDAAGFLPPFILKPVRCLPVRPHYVSSRDGGWSAYAPPTAHQQKIARAQPALPLAVDYRL